METLIIINPVSGQSTSKLVYQQNKSLLSNYLKINELVTLHADHVNEYFSDNLDEIIEKKLIIGIGGDGLMFQIINNLKKYDLNLIISEIPTGSGSGFFKSLMFKNNKLPTIKNAVDLIKSPHIFTTDLLYIKNLNIYSRLSISWGIISNIDIDTEWMRLLGEYRFDLGGIYQVLTNPYYKGLLSFTIDGDTTILNKKFSFVWAGNVSHPSTNLMAFPHAKFNDNKIHLVYLMDDVYRYELISILLGLSDGSYLKHPKVHYYQVDKFSLQIDENKIVVDGEVISSQEIIVETKQNQLKILDYIN